jgi:hypothetical protein
MVCEIQLCEDCMKIGIDCVCDEDKGKELLVIGSKSMKGKASRPSCTATSERVERVGSAAARERSSLEKSKAFPKSGATYSGGAKAPAPFSRRQKPLRSLEGPEWAKAAPPSAQFWLGSDMGDSDWELAGATSCAWSAPASLGPSRFPSAMPSPRGKGGSGGATPSERFDRTPSPEFPHRASLEAVRAQLEEQAAQLRRAAGASDGFANHMCYERATEAGDGGGALALGGGGGGAVAPGGGGGVAVAPGGLPAGANPEMLAVLQKVMQRQGELAVVLSQMNTSRSSSGSSSKKSSRRPSQVA